MSKKVTDKMGLIPQDNVTLAPILETFHSRGEELARRVEFYTDFVI